MGKLRREYIFSKILHPAPTHGPAGYSHTQTHRPTHTPTPPPRRHTCLVQRLWLNNPGPVIVCTVGTWVAFYLSHNTQHQILIQTQTRAIKPTTRPPGQNRNAPAKFQPEIVHRVGSSTGGPAAPLFLKD